MRALHVVLKPRYSGAEILVRDLAIYHRSYGISVGIASLAPPEDNFMPVIRQLENRGVEWYIPDHTLSRWERVKFLKYWISQYSPDILIAHSVIPAFYARVALMGVYYPKSVIVLHAADDYRDWRFRLPEYLLWRKATCVVAVSPEGAENYKRKFPRACVEVVPNGIDLERFSQAQRLRWELRERLAIPSSSRIVLQIGRVAPEKRQHLSLYAIAPIMRSDLSVELWFLGLVENEDYKAQLLKAARKLGIVDRVRFWGGRPDVEVFLSVSDISLLPSEREAHSVAMLESLASGIEVVASDIPAFAFAAKYPGVHLIDPENISEFTTSIEIALAKSGRYPRDLREFSIKETANRYLVLWDRILRDA